MSSDRDKEFKAFHIARANPVADRRKSAFAKLSRPHFFRRLVAEGEYKDTRLAALEKLAPRDGVPVTSEEYALYLKLATTDPEPEIRLIAAARVKLSDRKKLINSPFPNVRAFLAQTTSWREGLQRMLIDPDPAVRAEAERGLKKKDLQGPSLTLMN